MNLERYALKLYRNIGAFVWHCQCFCPAKNAKLIRFFRKLLSDPACPAAPPPAPLLRLRLHRDSSSSSSSSRQQRHWQQQHPREQGMHRRPDGRALLLLQRLQLLLLSLPPLRLPHGRPQQQDRGQGDGGRERGEVRKWYIVSQNS